MFNTFLLILLVFIIYCVIKVRRFFKAIDPSQFQQKPPEKTSKLERDPKTGVYKPKKDE